MDWEEGLWGTDPTKKDTDDDGVADDNEIAVLKGETVSSTGSTATTNVKLTETEKFSQELLTTIATLSQSGSLDEATVEQIGISLAENIGNSAQEKEYNPSDIKIISDNSVEAIQKYKDIRDGIYMKYYTNQTTLGVLQEFIDDEENTSILLKFDPIISQKKKIISELVKMPVPQSLASLHLSLINVSQGILENVIAMKTIDSDPLTAMSAITQYEQNLSDLEILANQLTELFNQKLNN